MSVPRTNQTMSAASRDCIGGSASPAGLGGSGKKRETRAWYSAYRGYFREDRFSVTSSDACGSKKRRLRKKAPAIVQLSNGAPAAIEKR